MSELKNFTIVYKAEVTRLAYVEAKDEEGAIKEFYDGNFEEGDEIDCGEVELVEVEDEEYD